MVNKPEFSIPEPTLRRLPRYYNYLKSLLHNGREVVSCTHIGKDLKLDPPQIRKDLAYTGIRGLPKVGYQIDLLLNSIAEFLGWNNMEEAFLVGIGNMGRALIDYKGFQRCGFKIVAAFDHSPEVVGKTFGGLEILPVSKLTNLCLRMNVKIGVITTPENTAQEAADLMIAGGILGIWNFAPSEIRTPEEVIVQNESLTTGLAVLSKKLQMLKQSGKFISGGQ